MRNAAHPCPVVGCTNLRLRWAAVCPACWRRLPSDIKVMFDRAKAARDRAARARAGIAARDWLNAHPNADAIARACGDAP